MGEQHMCRKIINPDVTIVVTVHNAENYIEQCVQSAMKQTYENIEIICIDGGSSDSTPDILRSLQSLDDRIAIVNDKNTSYGHKVNVGIEKARGQYVCILESDDSLERDMVKILYKIAKENNVDVVSGDYKVQFEYHGQMIGFARHKYPVNLYNQICDLKNGKRFFTHGGITGTLYKKSFLEKNNIKLNETPGAAFQDQSFSFLVDLLSMTQFHIEIPVYNYTYDNPDSSVADDKKIMEISWECNYIEQQMNMRNIQEQYIWEMYYNFKYAAYIDKMKSFSIDGKMKFKKQFLEEYKKDQSEIEKRSVCLAPSIKEELMIFVENQDCFDMYSPKERPAKRMANILDVQSQYPTVLVGAGRVGNYLIQVADACGKKFKCVCDNSKKLQNTKWNDYYVETLEAAAKKYKGCKFVISVERFFDEIKAQLMSLGIEESDIVRY